MAFGTGGSVNLGSAFGSITVSMDGARRQLNRQIGELERGVTSSFGRIGSQVQSLGVNMTKVLAPVTGFVIGGITSFAKFDDILTEIEARTGATAAEMEQVRLTALQMGQDTAFSATQASDGMLQLLSSGFDLTQTFAALPSVLDLAAAGMLDVGLAGDAVTDILAQFNLTAEESEMVANALAQASGSSSATINDLIQGFANVGPIASQFGLDIEQTAAALAVFSENGIKGSEAGTQLKSLLTNMASTVPKTTAMWDKLGVSMFDAEGQMRDFDTIIDDLNVAMEGMSDEERIEVVRTLGGAYGQMGLSALLTADGIDTMQDAMSTAATAADLGKARMDSFKGVVDLLKSSLETIAINVIGPLVENYLQPLVESVTEILNEFNEWLMMNPELAATLGLIAGVLAIIGPAITILGVALSMLLSPLGLIIAGVSAVAFVFQDSLKPLTKVIDIFLAFFDQLKMAFDAGGLPRAVEFFFKRIGRVMGRVGGIIGDVLLDIGESIGEKFRDMGQWLADSGVFEFLFQELPRRIGDTLRVVLPQVGRLLGQGLRWLIGNAIPLLFGALAALGSFLFNALPGILEGLAGFIFEILKGVVMGIVDGISTVWPIIQPHLEQMFADLVNWFTSGQGLVDLSGFGLWLLDRLQQGLASLTGIGNYLWDNFIKPMVDDLINWFTSGQAATDLGILATALGDGLLAAFALLGEGAVWLWDNLFKPMLAALAEWFTSGQAASDFNSITKAVMDALLAAFTLLGEGAVWLWDNLFKPMLDSVAEWFTSGQAASDFNSITKAVMDALLAAFTLLGEGGVWLWDNLFKPMLIALAEWFTSGQAAEDLGKIAGALLTSLLSAFGLLLEGASWLWDNLFKPMLIALAEWFTSGQAATDLAAIATALLDKLSEAFDPMLTWANDNIVQPIVDDMDKLVGLVQPIIDDFVGLFDDVLDKLGDIATALNLDTVLDALKTAFSNAFGFVEEVIGLVAGKIQNVVDGIRNVMDALGGILGIGGGGDGLTDEERETLSTDVTTHRGGHAAGTPWTGNMGRNVVAGTVHGQEGVIPARQRGGLTVFPGRNGATLEGLDSFVMQSLFGGGAGGSMMPAMATAGGAGAGDTNLNFNGDIQVGVSEDVLRDPNMIELAQQYGQSFRDGLLTNADIVERVRGQS